MANLSTLRVASPCPGRRSLLAAAGLLTALHGQPARADDPPLVRARHPVQVAVSHAPPGRLLVRVLPWAIVRIDGRTVGTTPLPPIDVPAGTHEVELENGDLHIRRTITVDIKSGQTSKIQQKLEDWADSPSPQAVAKQSDGVILVDALPSATVRIDGQVMGLTPLATQLPPGSHQVELRNAALGVTRTVTVEVRDGATADVREDMNR